MPLFLFAAVGPVISLIVRFRHSRGVERLQLKWFTWAVAVTAVLWIGGVAAAVGTAEAIVEPLALLSMCLTPITIGIAVLRYRLYEIDRLISRTLVYGAVDGGARRARTSGSCSRGRRCSRRSPEARTSRSPRRRSSSRRSSFPVRSRVQRFVDRRFYRRRYDAQRTLEGFGARLREQIDLGTLEHDLAGVVTETMQPTHASVWLRTGAPS